jgi:hypothetical protein
MLDKLVSQNFIEKDTDVRKTAAAATLACLMTAASLKKQHADRVTVIGKTLSKTTNTIKYTPWQAYTMSSMMI